MFHIIILLSRLWNQKYDRQLSRGNSTYDAAIYFRCYYPGSHDRYSITPPDLHTASRLPCSPEFKINNVIRLPGLWVGLVMGACKE